MRAGRRVLLCLLPRPPKPTTNHRCDQQLQQTGRGQGDGQVADPQPPRRHQAVRAQVAAAGRVAADTGAEAGGARCFFFALLLGATLLLLPSSHNTTTTTNNHCTTDAQEHAGDGGGDARRDQGACVLAVERVRGGVAPVLSGFGAHYLSTQHETPFSPLSRPQTKTQKNAPQKTTTGDARDEPRDEPAQHAKGADGV